jgi:transposase
MCMTRAGVISDELWAVIKPVLPSDVGRRGKRWADHRRIMAGIVWRFRVGAPWRDLPRDFGPWQTVWKRHYRWSTDGTYARMFLAVQQAFGSSSSAADPLVSVISVDSTSIRAHQHAAGARTDVLTGVTSTGGAVELHDSAA